MSRTGEPREPFWTEAEKAFVCEKYGTMPVAEIAAALGRSYDSATRMAGRLGVATGAKVPWAEAEDAYLRANYLTVSARELADHLGRPHSSVRQRVRALGLANEQNEAQKTRRAAIRHGYFSSVDSPLKAYILGWLAADGYINKSEVRIGLHRKDAYIVRLIRDELAPLHELAERMTGPEGKSPQTLLRISSPQMTEDLARWGIVPAKSLILRYPADLPAELDSSFICGYYDGDGCLGKHVPRPGARNYYRWSLVSGSKPLLLDIRDRIFVNTGVLPCGPRLQRKDSNVQVIYTTCANVIPVDAWLHADVPGLARKRLPVGRRAADA